MKKELSRGIVITTLSCAISFLLLMIMLKFSIKISAALASGSIFEMFGVRDIVWSTQRPHSDVWVPPVWIEEDLSTDVWMLNEMDGTSSHVNGPTIKARAAFVFDLDRGEVLFEKDADGIWPVASLTKTVSALTLAAEGFDHSLLEQEYCLTTESKPSLPGAKTQFSHKNCYSGWDLFGSALVTSDNGAALSFPLIAGMNTEQFVDRMNTVAQELNMTSSSFVDSAGMADENLSTARDMTKAIVAAALHPTVSISAGASSWYSKPNIHRSSFRRNTTNQLITLANSHTLASKTGFTFTADGCFSTVIEYSGRRLAVTILGSPTLNQRWTDTKKILNWVVSR